MSPPISITKELTKAAAPLVELSDKERNRYSISRAILAAAEGFSCFELEVSDEIERRLRSMPTFRHGGVFVPTSLHSPEVNKVLVAKLGRSVVMDTLAIRAGLDSATTTKGAELLFTAAGTLIEALIAKTRVIMLGATFLEGIREDNLGLPKIDLGITSDWVSDNPGSNRPSADLTLDQVPLKASLLESPSMAFSRQLLAQSTPAIDAIVARYVAFANAVAIDRSALHGSGVSPEPLGIYNAPDVTPIAFGGPITYSKVVAMEKAVGVQNADSGPCGYITTPEVRANARESQVFAGNGGPLWTGDNERGQMNSYRSFATNQIRKDLGAGSNEHGILFGAWSDLIIGEFGATELVVDKFSSKKRGMVEVNSFLLAGIAIGHGESFSKGTGLTVS
jgi:HK97 family phage major capsid protein